MWSSGNFFLAFVGQIDGPAVRIGILTGLTNEQLGGTGDDRSDGVKNGIVTNGVNFDGVNCEIDEDGVNCHMDEDGVNCHIDKVGVNEETSKGNVKPKAKERKHRGTFLANGLPALDILDINVKNSSSSSSSADLTKSRRSGTSTLFAHREGGIDGGADCGSRDAEYINNGADSRNHGAEGGNYDAEYRNNGADSRNHGAEGGSYGIDSGSRGADGRNFSDDNVKRVPSYSSRGSLASKGSQAGFVARCGSKPARGAFNAGGAFHAVDVEEGGDGVDSPSDDGKKAFGGEESGRERGMNGGNGFKMAGYESGVAGLGGEYGVGVDGRWSAIDLTKKTSQQSKKSNSSQSKSENNVASTTMKILQILKCKRSINPIARLKVENSHEEVDVEALLGNSKEQLIVNQGESMQSCFEAFQPYTGSEDEEPKETTIMENIFEYIEDDMDAYQGLKVVAVGVTGTVVFVISGVLVTWLI